MIIEISIQNESYYNGGISQAIKDGYFTEWTPERIKKAFNFGNGTQKDFLNYMQNNKGLCIFKEI